MRFGPCLGMLGQDRYKKQDRRNLGVPAILTNHNKQTYANYALFPRTVAISNKIFFRFLEKLLQLSDFEEENFYVFFTLTPSKKVHGNTRHANKPQTAAVLNSSREALILTRMKILKHL